MSQRQSPKPDGRVTNTRQRILRRAEYFYYKGGYAGISLQELADSLNISKAALFHHFESKQDIFFEMLLEMLAHRQHIITEAIAQGDTTAARLRHILRAMKGSPFFDPMKFLTDEKGNLSLEQQQEVEGAFYRSIQQPIVGVLNEGVQRGELRPHHTLLSAMIFLNLTMLLPSPGHPNTRLGQQGEPELYLDELLAFFLHGISNPPSAP
jgi:AcrR family transcriptional regulator